ncbi:MAG: ABC-F type ribosomal protection protein [Clostridia bacterium]|nr:ABC-F type ribosomal protection protein [Clostridia bacterium]
MKANEINLSFGTQVIFDDASFQINDNDKIGIVGVNGAGKTTLFKVLLGTCELDSGTINFGNSRIGYLPQELKFDDDDTTTVWDYLYDARPIRKLEKELNEIYEKLSVNPEDMNLVRRMGKIQEMLEHLDCYNAEDILIDLIEEMQIDPDILDKKISELSGGQKSKLAFAHLLFSDSDIMLLDEPTNHLDASTRNYISNYLKNYRGSVLIISHDIDFLNEISNKILFVDKTTHKTKIYTGNYSEFKKKYAQEKLLKSLRIEQQEKEIKKLSEFVLKARQASATNHNLKKAGQDREKKLAKKLEELEKRDKVYKKVKMQLIPKRESPKVPIEVDNISFAYPNEKTLYNKLSFNLYGNERFLVVGENGVGKSTLLKLIVGKLSPSKGEIKINNKTDIAYYAQELELIDENKNVFENTEDYDYTDIQRRNLLGNFLFQGNDVFKKASVLSPGEKARVALCKILMQKANLLILDEPTNHLDPETQAIIGDNFRDYTGTIIVVSHNPSFVEQIGITRMLILPEGQIIDYSRELLEYYYILNEDML